jgi:type I restriction enzyme S subunit
MTAIADKEWAGRSRILEQFALLSEVAGGLKLLREVVLDWAARGLLVPQVAADGTADGVLELVRHHRPLLPSKHRARLCDAALRFDDRDAPYAIPPSWRWVRLGALGAFMGGGTPSKANSSFWSGSIPWVSPKDMKQLLIGDAEDHISESAIAASPAKLVPQNSLLCVVRGMILAHSFPVALTTRPVTINQDMKALVPAVPELGKYLLLAARAARERVLAKVLRSGHGTCRLESEVVEELPVAIPPLAEQRRIVAKVDQLMALCDELEAKQTKKREFGDRLTKAALRALTSADTLKEFEVALERAGEHFSVLFNTPESVGDLRKALRVLAVTGRIVGQRADEGCGGDRVPELRHDLGKHGIAWREPDPQAVCADALLGVPPSWTWVRLENLALFGPRNGYSPKAVEYPTKTKSLTLTATTSGRFDERQFKFIDEVVSDNSHLWLEDGDLLIQRSNTIDYVGAAAIYRGESKRFIYPDLMMKVRLSSHVDHEWVHAVLLSEPIRAYFRARATGTAGSMPKINQGVVQGTPIPLPPLAEQRRIVAKLNHFMEACDGLEARLRERDEKAAMLAHALVGHAMN